MSLARRWEAPSSTGGKFWEVIQDGVNVTTKWGRLTATGQSKTTVFGDEAAAKKFVETTIKKKEKEGYALKTAKSSSKALVAPAKPEEVPEPVPIKRAETKALRRFAKENPKAYEQFLKGATIAALKEELKEYGVEATGKKELLIARCMYCSGLSDKDPDAVEPQGPVPKKPLPKDLSTLLPKDFDESGLLTQEEQLIKLLKTTRGPISGEKLAQVSALCKKRKVDIHAYPTLKELGGVLETKKEKTAPAKKAIAKAPVKAEPEGEEEEEDGSVPTSYVLPLLYNIDTKGKERVHFSWVKKNVLTKKHGETNGKHTLADRSFEGKNIGRSNETDANEQACREAERDWVKQVNKGYKPKTTDKKGYAVYKKVIAEKAKQGGVNTNAWMILAKDLRGVEVEELAPKPKSVSAAKTAAEKAKKKANNGTLPGYVSDLFPMGCQKLVPPNRAPSDPEEKVLKYLDFENGVYIQRKLDGIRCLVRIIKKDGKKHVVLTSRASNQFVYLKGLREEVLNFLKGHEDVVLDCEVYQHEIRASASYKKVGGKNKVVFSEGTEIIPRIMNFKAITSAVRSSMTDPSPLEDQLCLHVFDIVDPTEKLTQDERFEKLDALFSRKGISGPKGTCPKIIKVERYEIYSPEEIPVYQEKFFNEGYEGVVLRDRSLKYECLKKNKRSKWMRKYKYFFDAEYEIIGVDRDKGVPREQFSWLCRTEDGTEFKAKPEGTREMKWEWYDNRDEIIGKMLIVRYQDLEDSGKPRFPIAIEIRDFE